MRTPVLHSSHWSRIFHDTHPHPHCRPLLSSPFFLSSLSPLISPSICPPIGALFHPSPAPFHPSPALWSLIISSFHKSNLTSLFPPFPPSLILPLPRTTEQARNMWPGRWELAGPPPAVPPYVDLSPLVPYWFCFKQGKNTRRMRCWRWHEIKKNRGKGEREWRGRRGERKSASMYQIYELSPGWVQGIIRRYCAEAEIKKKGTED